MILKDIKGYMDMSYEQHYSEEDMWEGTILLSENGYFEGLVKIKNSKEESFIFGIYYPGKYIKLFKLGELVSTKPHTYDAKIEDSEYEGNFYETELFGEEVCGNCKISIIDTEILQENDIDLIVLESKIDSWKKYKMNALNRDFYVRQTNAMKVLSESELMAIISKCVPINKNLMEPRIYYKLVRKIINIFQPDKK